MYILSYPSNLEQLLHRSDLMIAQLAPLAISNHTWGPFGNIISERPVATLLRCCDVPSLLLLRLYWRYWVKN